MSMECDTRLAMMSLRANADRPAPRRRTSRARRFSAGAFAVMAAFALTLFSSAA